MDSIFDINVNKFNIRLSAGHKIIRRKKFFPKNFRFLTVFFVLVLMVGGHATSRGSVDHISTFWKWKNSAVINGVTIVQLGK